MPFLQEDLGIHPWAAQVACSGSSRPRSRGAQVSRSLEPPGFSWSQSQRRPVVVGAGSGCWTRSTGRGPPSGAGRVDALDVGDTQKLAGCLLLQAEVLAEGEERPLPGGQREQGVRRHEARGVSCPRNGAPGLPLCSRGMSQPPWAVAASL